MKKRLLKGFFGLNLGYYFNSKTQNSITLSLTLMRHPILFALLVVLTLSSCAKNLSPFTTQLQRTQNWSESDLKRIQFYNSEDIILHRAVNENLSEVHRGAIKIINGQRIEEIVIPALTPGVLVFQPETNRFGIAFEEGGESRYLMFGPDPSQGGRYRLLARALKRQNVIEVIYDGTTYKTQINHRRAPYLLIDIDARRTTERNARRAGGIRIDE